jgi:hypothetical protein
MSLSINSSDPSARTSLSNDDDAKKTDHAQARASKDFDFSGASYSAVNLPTLAARPTKATLAHDAADVATKAKKVAEDLKDPELQKLLAAGGKTGLAAAQVIGDALSVAKAAPEAVEGSPKAILEVVKDSLDLVDHSMDLYEGAKQLKEANTPEARAKLSQFLSDIRAMEHSGAKLGADARKYVVGF